MREHLDPPAEGICGSPVSSNTMIRMTSIDVIAARAAFTAPALLKGLMV
jgi:hypothetical protein